MIYWYKIEANSPEYCHKSVISHTQIFSESELSKLLEQAEVIVWKKYVLEYGKRHIEHHKRSMAKIEEMNKKYPDTDWEKHYSEQFEEGWSEYYELHFDEVIDELCTLHGFKRIELTEVVARHAWSSIKGVEKCEKCGNVKLAGNTFNNGPLPHHCINERERNR